ncbi:S1 RNA-binding domain-containing protein [Candidatus Microgenomates bacterium]|nr:S1 RNA-binding domain-containing protein [Candidatus Microgenomates bacterium]
MEELLKGYSWAGFKKGEVLTGTVSSISGKEVLIDFGGKMEGVVGEKEWDQVKDYVAKLKPGEKIEAIVISPETERGQMVVSIRKTGSKYRWQKAQELLSSGEPVNVKGVEVNKGGLVVEFEGVRGFVPGSQLSGEHQAEINKLLNRVISVKVIEVDEKQNRLIFSEKAVTGAADLAQKLKDLRSKIKIGEKYSGKVAAVMPYGIFVTLESGADGLVHISEVTWQKVENLTELFKTGDEVEVMVLGINETDGKLNLSIKQLTPDPWLSLSKKYSTDQQVKGEVTRVSSYGVFVRLDEGIEGLIHISKVPADADYKKGESVTCTVESIDAIAHRISLIPVLKAKPIGYK